jgi:quercetin dioxygenase-like cupin family protein
MRKAIALSIALGSWATALAVADEPAAPIPDPVSAYPENYTVLFEDERVRVLDFRLRRGATEDFHRHPPNVAVFLGDFRIRFRLPDGSVAERVAHPGEVAYSPAPVVHSPVNVGDTDAHGILIELKQAAGSAPSGGAVP